MKYLLNVSLKYTKTCATKKIQGASAARAMLPNLSSINSILQR
jgi:hypothetical protein